jgi:hypothetical protein
MTATSFTFGWLLSRSSNSAGGTFAKQTHLIGVNKAALCIIYHLKAFNLD